MNRFFRCLRNGALFFFAALLAACGGGGGDSAAPAATVLTFTVSPANGATGVALTATISATASEPLNAATLNGATFILAEVGGGSVNGRIAVSGSTATFTPDFPLTQNTQYMATLTTGAASTTGKSLAANLSSSFTTVTVPGAPTGAGAVASAPAGAAPGTPVGQATVTFSAPASNGGSAITGYTVTSNPGGITASSVGPLPPPGGVVVSTLLVGTPYTFTVVATNSVGNGPPSAPTNSTTPTAGATAPGAPTAVSATASNPQATVSFTAPASTGGSAIVSYTVTSSPGSITASGGATTIVVPGLTSGTAYTFTVVASNAVGPGPASLPSNAATPASPPGAPTGVSAGASAPVGALPGTPVGQATVTFSAPASNGGSAITGYTATSNPGNIVASSVGPLPPPGGVVVSNLLVGTPYTFTVTATNGGATPPTPPGGPLTSAPSAPSGSVTPVPGTTVPNAPAAPTAVAGNAQATVSFTPLLTAPANGGSPVIDYTVTALVGGVPTAVAATGGTSPIVVPGLINGTAYTFTVRARNVNGNSLPSPASAVPVTPATAPGAPTAVSASAGNGQATVSFTPPASTGGRPITDYTVTPNPSTPGFVVTPAGGSTLSRTVTGLTNGIAYTFTVTATNAGTLPVPPGVPLTSVPSTPSNIVTPSVGSPADAPTGASATNTTPATPHRVVGTAFGEASITFTAPVNPGGSAITSYTVTSSPGGISANGTGSPINVTGLLIGTPYTFSVTANNLAGASLPSAPTLPITPVTVPGTPAPVSATAGNLQATVSFTPPASNGGAAISNYLVISTPGGINVFGAAPSIVVPGLSNNIAYTFTVTAFNSAGAGAPSAATTPVTPNPALTVSGPPTAIGATNTTPASPNRAVGSAFGQASVSFTPPAGFTAPTCALPACSPVTSYTVTASPGGITATGAASPIVVTGLNIGTAYTFTVVANNGVGSSPPSGASAQVIPATVPGQPLHPNPTAGVLSATVAFTPLSASANGGSAIINYTVRAFTFPANVLAATVTGSASPILVGGLTNQQYRFTVAATNSIGTGLQSDLTGSNPIVQPDPAATVASAPTNVQAINPGDGTATVTYTPTPVGSNGGSFIHGYIITASPATPGIIIPNQSGCEPGPPVPLATGACPGAGPHQRIITGLTNGVAYTFTIVAVNGVGQSPPSGASNSVTPATNPSQMAAPTAVAGNGQATVTFTPLLTAPANGGRPITSYRVTASPGGAFMDGTASPITVTGLTNGQPGGYTFTVTATNVGTLPPNPGPLTSIASPPSTAVTPTGATVPGAPTIGTATAGNTQASVAFTPPASDGGSAITSYTVTSNPSGISATGAVSPITVTGLTNGQPGGYTFTVRATNAVGIGNPSAASNSVTPVGPPGAPTAVNAAGGNLQATITFTPPASNGGSAITGYTVTTRIAGAAQVPTISGAGSPIVVPNLLNGTTYTFTVTATSAGGTSADSLPSNAVTPANAPPACSNTVAVTSPSGVVSLRAQASRATGVSPLSVFFDATATTATGIARPYHDLEYRWDFGDPAGGATWGQGTRPGLISKNLALGPVAGHVFEPAPGSGTQTYTVVVSATSDNTPNNTASCSIPISVTDPNLVFPTTATVCISGVALPSPGNDGCPAGAAVLQNVDFDAAVATAIGAGRRRILFRRGETYNVSPGALIAVTGPGIVGAYGTGTRPRVAAANNNMQIFRLSSSSTPTVADWRIMDLDLDGLGGAPGATNRNVGLWSQGSYSQFTFLRLAMHDMQVGYLASAQSLDLLNSPTFTSPMWDQVAFVDSTIERIIGGLGGNALFHNGRRFTFLGNLIDDTLQAEHGLRSQFIDRGVISNNTVRRTARLTITLRGTFFAGTPTLPAGTFSEKHVVSDNRLEGSSTSFQIASTGPQFPGADERIRDAIWERNWYVAGSSTFGSMLVQSSDITLRNNLFDLSGVASGSGITVQHDGGTSPIPTRVSILNNTFFRGSTGGLFAISMDHGTDHRIHNNLARASAAGSSAAMFFGAATYATPPSHNSSDAQITGVNPNFAVTPPVNAEHWRLNVGSYAINGGTPVPVQVPVHSDFFATPRPIGPIGPTGPIDIGATEQ